MSISFLVDYKYLMHILQGLKERTISLRILSPMEALEESLIYQEFIKAHTFYDREMKKVSVKNIIIFEIDMLLILKYCKSFSFIVMVHTYK